MPEPVSHRENDPRWLPPCDHAVPTPGCMLLSQLSLERVDTHHFRGRTRSGRAVRGRSFGGHLAAQSALAAGPTVPTGRSLHSLHMYFLSAGRSVEPLDYAVSVLRDGGTFSTREVLVRQGRQERAVVLLSYQSAETSAEHEQAWTPHPVEPPDSAVVDASTDEMLAGLSYRTETEVDSPGTHRPTRRSWLRVEHEIPDGSSWHAALVAFVTDIGMSRTVDLPHVDRPGRRQAASLDHTVWFHRPVRADRWMHYEQVSPIYRGGRGLCEGRLFDSSGQLVATSVQEDLLRRVLEG